jgi:hypothetical protein
MQGIMRTATGDLSETLVLSATASPLDRLERGVRGDGRARMWSRLGPNNLAMAGVPIVVSLLSSITSAAPTPELAKKCATLTAKAFPSRVVGNPAAGSAKGSGRSEQDYFNDCIKKGGNIDPPSPSEGTSTQPIPIPVPRP